MITNVLTFVVKVWHQSVLPVRFRADYSELSEQLHDTHRVSDSYAQRQAVLTRIDTLLEGTDDDKKEALVLCRSLNSKVSATR